MGVKEAAVSRKPRLAAQGLLLLLLLVPPLQAAAQDGERGWMLKIDELGWTYRSMSADYGEMMFTRPFPGMLRRSWARFEYRESQDPAIGGRYMSSMVLFEFDCVQRRSRALQANYYARSNLAGESQVLSSASGWRYPPPGTMIESEMLRVCSAAAADPPKQPR